jgi:hypothetical protein
MDLNALEQDCYRRLGFNTGTPDTATQGRIRAYLNEAQQEILSEPGMESLTNDSITFASVASTPEYSLPPAVARVKTIYDTTNLITLTPAGQPWYRSAYPSPTAVAGIPDRWVDLGTSAVAKQPSNASELFVVSDAAADGATKTARIEGYITGGYFRSAAAVLNGVTAVSFGASITTWIEVTKFYVILTAGGETSAAGNLTLLEDSGIGTELARIHISQDYARYRRIALAICPSSAVTYTVDFERDIPDMSQAGDEPVIPPRFHRLLATGARMKEYEKQDDQARYLGARAEWVYGLKKLKYFVYSQAVGSPNLRGSSQARRPSRLGGWFGEDRW